MKNAIFWDVTPCGSLMTDVSEEHIEGKKAKKRHASVASYR
jgi:hypothetical protein